MFVDAQKMARLNPSTFTIPSFNDIRNLRKGDFVKVCHNEERFWVKLTKIDKQEFSGIVDNDLICEQPFKLGDSIVFSENNIYDILFESKS